MPRNQRQLRVIRKANPREYCVQQLLQEKRWWGWWTIDRENVPIYASIYNEFYGDTGEWVSKFDKIGTIGSDGVVTRHNNVAHCN